MKTHTLTRSRSELSEFLLHHRKKLSPADVGLPISTRRRTPGLRREEVAALAGVGLTWYTWFEQGREIQVSESFLLNVSKALRLNDSECCHLFLLAHRRPPPAEAYEQTSVSPLIQQLLDDLVQRPAYVINLQWNVIAWNAAANDLFGFTARSPAERNFMRMIFANPELRSRLPDWHRDASRLLAQFRCDQAATPENSPTLELIEDLKKLSPDFRSWYQKPNMDSYSYGLGTVLDTQSKRHDFAHEALTVDEHRHLKLIAYFKQ